MKKKLLSLLFILALTMGITLTAALENPVSAVAGEKYTLNLSGTFNYASGQEMIGYINDERAGQGAGALKLDSQLTDAAMQRAAEIAYFFDHTRPDGTQWSTVNTRAFGENIAAGRTTASATFDQWMNSQGHRENMMSARYTRIGIGHFYHNGLNYWVQLFGIDAKNYAEARTNTADVSVAISIVEGTSPVLINGGVLSPDSMLNLIIGNTAPLKLSAVNADWTYASCVFDPDSFNWSSDHPSIASVSEDGVVTAVSVGQTTIRVTAKKGSVSGLYFKVNVGKDIGKMTIAEIPSVAYCGTAHTPSVSIKDGSTVLKEGRDYTLSYRNNINAGTAYVDIKGMGSYEGTTTKTFNITSIDLTDKTEIQIDSWDDSAYGSTRDFLMDTMRVTYNDKVLTAGNDYSVYAITRVGSQPYSVTIRYLGNYSGKSVIYNLEKCIIASIPDQAYTGQPLTPELGNNLQEGKDYHAVFSNNINLGTAKVVVQGLGNYKGIVTRTFNIVPIDIGTKDFVLSQQSFTYDGQNKEPGVIIDGLNEGTDYTVSYGENINAGKGTVIIKGLGRYTGTVEKSFTIEPAKMQGVTATDATFVYDGKSHSIAVQGVPAGAEITYAKMMKGPYTSTLPTLTDAGEIRIYYRVEKENYHTVTGSAFLTIEPAVLPDNITLSFVQTVYTGETKMPEVVVRDADGNMMSEGRDYIVKYGAGKTLPGNYNVQITAAGNYSGSKILTFTIVPKKPDAVSAKLTTYKAVKISWSESVGATGYNVYYKKAVSKKWTLMNSTTKTSLKKANLAGGIKYNFKVIPYYQELGSKTKSFSGAQYKIATVTTLKKVKLNKVVKSGIKVKVTWNDLQGESGYQISRATKKNGKYTIICKTIKSNTKSRLVKAKKGKTYWYRVRAYKTVNNKPVFGPWSAPKKFKRYR